MSKKKHPKFLQNKFTIVFLIEVLILLIFLLNLKNIIYSYRYLKTINREDLSLYFKDLLFSYDLKNEIERVDLKLNFKNILLLDCLRAKEDSCIKNNWAEGKLIYNGKFFPVKIKAKGDRFNLHRKNFKTMSFKVDHTNKERFRGMEEYSIQRPIIRNYSFELLASRLVSKNNIISPRNFYIKLYINGEYFGIRHVEEAMAKELIESKGYRYGPIFSLEEEYGYKYGETRFDLSDFRYWNKSAFDIHNKGLTLLESSQNNTLLINEFFNMKKWANYFALMDILYMKHGSVPKSVKFYLNPTNGLVEPIFFDGHINTFNNHDKCLLIDFVIKSKNESDCGWIKHQNKWYVSFFNKDNQINKDFYIYYFNYLNKLSSLNYENNIINKEIKDLRIIRGEFYRGFYPFDAISKEGKFPHIAKISYLKKRIEFIRKNINKALKVEPFITFDKNKNLISFINQASNLPQIINFKCEGNISNSYIILKGKNYLIDLTNLGNNCGINNTSYSINQTKSFNEIRFQLKGDMNFYNKLNQKNDNLVLKIEKNNGKGKFKFKKTNEYYKNIILEDKLINFDNNSKICLSNSSVLKISNSIITSNNKSLKISGCGNNPGSLLIENSIIQLNKLTAENLSSPNLNLYSLYGGINIINSNLSLKKLELNKSNSEDAINFVNSSAKIKTIVAKNIQSDAIDFDSSKFKIGNVLCTNIKNDCIDLSFSKGSIGDIQANNIGDKVLSVGEFSKGKIEKMNNTDSSIGLAVKDSSYLEVNKIVNNNVKFPISVFIKKKEFNKPELRINKIINKNIDEYLISKDSSVFINNKEIQGNYESKEIINLLYEKVYRIKPKK